VAVTKDIMERKVRFKEIKRVMEDFTMVDVNTKNAFLFC
jgi:hypothetical protein